MTLFSEFTDPRLVPLYDALDTSRVDTAFYLELADERPGSTIIDIGCGTGLLACELARRGHGVIGVDPASEMLRIARQRPGGDQVRWIEGDASQLDVTGADLVVMTAHVAQVIADEATWTMTLAAAHRSLKPGGRIAFESRDPRASAWLDWTPERSLRRADDPAFGGVDVWLDVREVARDLVRYAIHYWFTATSEELVSENELRFRSEGDLTAGLVAAGFAVENLFGDWDRRPPAAGTPELIYIATKR